MNYSNAFMIMLFRDLRIAFRQRAEIMLPVIFFVVIVSLFPLAISPDPAVLKNIGPGIIWVAAAAETGGLDKALLPSNMEGISGYDAVG